jgi:16S rRNA (cytidine1402-2'-O)-methyltransferase
VVLVRELTKLHEEVWRGTLDEAGERPDEPRGEYVVVLEGAPPPPPVTDEAIESSLRGELGRGTGRREAVASVAAELGVPKRRVYDASVRLRP